MGWIEVTDEIKLRDAGPEHRALAEAWIEADSYHRGIVTPEFLLQPRGNCYLVEDEQGPVFFLKLRRAARLDVQFAPQSAAMRARTRRVLHEGFPPLGAMLAEQGFDEALFWTSNPALARSMQKRAGFLHLGGEMVRVLQKGGQGDVR